MKKRQKDTVNKSTSKYDLEERTARFGEKIIELCKKAPKTVVTTPIINQSVKAGTSMGANYYEANGASSKRDFRNKIFICKKEAKETKYWLRMLAKAVEDLTSGCRELWKEAEELTRIFSRIVTSAQ